jgi:four helix bundle protein
MKKGTAWLARKAHKASNMPFAQRDIQERAFRFACDVVRFCSGRTHLSPVDLKLILQLSAAATAIGANLEEAVAGQTKADFIAKVFIALKEARETHYWLRLLAASNAAADPQLTSLVAEADQLVAILTAILRNARTNPSRG